MSASTRQYWIDTACRITAPVLENLSKRTLRKNMPVEMQAGSGRERVSHLEAFGRSLAGLAPWLELGEPASRPFTDQAILALDAATDPESPDYCNFHILSQPLVDTAFMAQGLLRAPKALWEPLDQRVKDNVIRALKATRKVRVMRPNNWLLFSGLVETALYVFGDQEWDRMRIDYALQMHKQWYLGDGVYGDGPNFCADYYNAFVIQPMLVDIYRHVGEAGGWTDLGPKIFARAIRYSTQQERMISPEGAFPPVGRSLAYRFGALQGLAQMALLQKLEIAPAQARCAMTAVIRRMIEAAGTFDENGWLRIGFCGAQPAIGEAYISTGSLYMCSAGLLPIGLPVSASFWSDPDESWTSVKAWNGEAFPIDQAMQV